MVLVGLEQLRGAEDLHFDLAAREPLHVGRELVHVLSRVMCRRELVAHAHRDIGGLRAERGAGGEHGDARNQLVLHDFSSPLGCDGTASHGCVRGRDSNSSRDAGSPTAGETKKGRAIEPGPGTARRGGG